MKNQFTMGKSFNSHFGFVELPSDIIQVGLYDSQLEFDCVDGVYHVTKSFVPSEGLKIKKVFCKKDGRNTKNIPS